jgi:hypothetical protein
VQPRSGDNPAQARLSIFGLPVNSPTRTKESIKEAAQADIDAATPGTSKREAVNLRAWKPAADKNRALVAGYESWMQLKAAVCPLRSAGPAIARTAGPPATAAGA